MGNRRHWAAGTGVAVAAAALLMSGLTATALGSALTGVRATPAASPGRPGPARPIRHIRATPARPRADKRA